MDALIWFCLALAVLASVMLLRSLWGMSMPPAPSETLTVDDTRHVYPGDKFKMGDAWIVVKSVDSPTTLTIERAEP